MTGTHTSLKKIIKVKETRDSMRAFGDSSRIQTGPVQSMGSEQQYKSHTHKMKEVPCRDRGT